MQIKRLENTLGCALFSRAARRVALTAEGERLLSYARRLLKLNEEAVGAFIKPSLNGQVRLGAPADIGTHILPGLLSLFARTHPGIEVNVSVGRSVDMIQRIDAGELDVALISVGNLGQHDTRGQVVHREPLVWAGRAGGVAMRRNPLPLALASAECAWRRQALDALDRVGRSYRIAYSSEQCAGQEAAMIADLAVAPYPLSLVRPPLRRLDEDADLPTLGEYQIKLLSAAKCSEPVKVLSQQVVAAFAAYH
ncbi:DNA-binding transcriptional LysR family regulator [Stutzerimonas stutzeri]|jgi:DNA-binding transcriptional LysR family regulator|uniref:DNA-binding transcriptional LysR family regulator n=1 Tax=Stutzerimonas stutzeri TaxID=316 RepID=A0A5S5B6U2_STUST|nr:DNA-binding transcriptional LysR family regulator [Stutzerimonas stutzeri]